MLAIVALAALSTPSQRAEAQVPEYKLKAEFLERFTRFIEWPPDPHGTAPGSFVICLYGENPFGDALDDLAANRKIKERPVSVRVIRSLAEVEACQILFLPVSQKDSLEKILLRTTGRPILTVGDTEGFAERGVAINFYSSDRNVRFEINDAAARRNGLDISSRLRKLARVVAPEDPR